jgi:membrane protein DedA with SNARE-associated domain
MAAGGRPPKLISMSLRAARTICLATLALQAAYSVVLIPLVPGLLGSHPVLLEALQASMAAMAAGGAFARVGEASLVLALLAPLPTLVMSDPLLWWAGRLWGPKAARYLGGRGPRGGRRADRAVDLLSRYGAWAVVLARFLPLPIAVVYAAAGWNGMRLRRFVALDLAGTALWVALIVGLGYAIGRPAVHVVQAITRYGLLLGIAVGVVTVVVMGARAFAQRRPAFRSGRPACGARCAEETRRSA